MTSSLRCWICYILTAVAHGHFRVEQTDMDAESNKNVTQTSATIDQGVVTASVAHSGQIVIENIPKLLNDQPVQKSHVKGEEASKNELTTVVNQSCPLAFDDCDFFTEDKRLINCGIEHNSRLMYGKYIPPTASVLEIGARYGQTSCALSGLLRERGKLTSVEADPRVWSALEENLSRKNCRFERFHVVKGVVGRTPKIMDGGGYGAHTDTVNNSEDLSPAEILRRRKLRASPHPLETLDGPFDTLCIDCEGCFETFLSENPGLLRTLKLIIVESHTDQSDKEEKEVERLLSTGRWKKVEQRKRQRVLCSSSSHCPVQDKRC